MPGHRRPRQRAPRVGMLGTRHHVGHHAPHMRRHLHAVPAITHRIVESLVLSCPWKAVYGDVDKTTPAVVDPRCGKLRKIFRESLAQYVAALFIGTRIGHREARPATPQQPVIGRHPKVIANVERRHITASMRKKRVELLLGQRFRHHDKTTHRRHAPLEPLQRPQA